MRVVDLVRNRLLVLKCQLLFTLDMVDVYFGLSGEKDVRPQELCAILPLVLVE